MGVYVTGIGIISALGRGWQQVAEALRNNRRGISPLTLFPHAQGFEVGEARGDFTDPGLPRTHQIARAAAMDALTACGGKTPGAIVIGVTTGGMPKTETLLKSGIDDPDMYRYHASGSVAEYLAGLCGCSGPVFTVSTACSSGAAAVALGARILQTNMAGSVLAGGADALCRLTYHGFNALQLLSVEGAKPFDRDRKGMSLGEGAAMLFMTAAGSPPENAVAEIIGIGLSCDAHHAASPHPEGRGAAEAMAAAIRDAGLAPTDIDYVNLHGTGTTGNDAAEAKAVNRVFGKSKPPASSVKGATGHSLAAAGAIEAVISIISISEGFIPGNPGIENPDPELDLAPQAEPVSEKITTVLSNSFGFGGNNAALVLGAPGSGKACAREKPLSMAVVGSACATGAGKTEETTRSFLKGIPFGGMLPSADLSAGLPPAAVRRLKRLPRLALCLANDAIRHAGLETPPSGVFFGTGWGALTETNDFLARLFQNREKFSSPMDFIGSVHNAPAGEIAMMFKATGANITMTGGDYSFEQALAAAFLAGDDTGTPFLVLGADEAHERLSPLLDPSFHPGRPLADGGGSLCLARREGGIQVRPVFFGKADMGGDTALEAMIDALGGENTIRSRYGALFAGIPAACRGIGEKQVDAFKTLTGCRAPVIDYRKGIGEFASASATATALAVRCLEQGIAPPPATGGKPTALGTPAILVMGTGSHLTAVEVFTT